MAPNPGLPPAPNAYTQSQIITLLVGHEREEFRVHKDLLISKSEYFRGCLTNECLELGNSIIILDEDNADAVRMFVDWLYTDRLVITEDQDAQMSLMYQFTDKVCSEQYVNDFIDAARSHDASQNYYSSVDLPRLYTYGLEATPFASYLLKAIVFTFLGQIGIRDKKHQREVLSYLDTWTSQPELLRDFAIESMVFHKKQYSDPAKWQGCHFHVHDGGSRCAAMGPESQISREA